MASIPKKVAERLVAGLKRYQPILAAAKARDVGETDTVTIVKDMLADIFGYDKYSELTSEYAIRGTYCDLAIKLDAKLSTLIEVKAHQPMSLPTFKQTPNQALQRTPGFGVQLPSAALIRPAQSRAVLPAMKPGTARAFALRRRAHSRAPGPESLSLGSLGLIHLCHIAKRNITKN
jgi:hypothetical protein